MAPVTTIVIFKIHAGLATIRNLYSGTTDYKLCTIVFTQKETRVLLQSHTENYNRINHLYFDQTPYKLHRNWFTNYNYGYWFNYYIGLQIIIMLHINMII